jgi:hypothetical protein
MALGAAPVHSAAHGEMDLSGWHEASQKAAKHMMDTYGPPAEMTDTMLIWHETGPWVKTIIYKDATTHNFPMEHPDVMQQWVHMDVPPELFDELAMYDGSVVVNRTEALISARCDKEGANFLAINLAHDIVSGERSVEEARDFYAETIKKVMNGEKPEYTTGFTFEVTDENLSNPDESVIDM